MTPFQAFLLSVLQGATEFLPVSSSGHLVIAEALLEKDATPLKGELLFYVLAHVGTLLSIVFVFRQQLLRLIRYVFVEAWDFPARGGPKGTWLEDSRGRLILAILLATAPTCVIGVLGKQRFEALFGSPHSVGWALCITAALLAATLFVKPRRGEDPESGNVSFPLWKAVLVGVMQGFAITPGISRSGSTIAVALLLGLDRRTAGEFSFLIAVPAIMGAVVLESLKFSATDTALSLPAGILAVAVSAVAGYVFLRLLLRFVRGGQFGYFAIYCLAVGIWAICWFPR